MVYIHHGGLFRHKEQNSFVGKCMELEIIMLSEISQTQKDKCHTFSLICGSQI
jgi:hypothetical protein